MTRNGKIARLPRDVRDQLNQRLEDGQPGRRVVEWLNSIPIVRYVLKEEFRGRPVSEQNLSEWKKGGFDDWRSHQDTKAAARMLVEEGNELADEGGDWPLSKRLSELAALALSRQLRRALAAPGTDIRFRRDLLAVAHELALLRRCDHEAERLRMERDRWEAERKEREKAAEPSPWQPVREAISHHLLAKTYGDFFKDADGNLLPAYADFLAQMGSRQVRGPTTDQSESDQVKPNQTGADR